MYSGCERVSGPTGSGCTGRFSVKSPPVRLSRLVHSASKHTKLLMERCNFERNFPVDKMGTGYATLWNAFKRITAGCSQIEKLALYSGTAKRLYHLD